MSHLELLSELRGVALRVHLQHLCVGEGVLVDGDGCLTAQTRLQDGVVDEHVLFLWERGGGRNVRRDFIKRESSKVDFARVPTFR